MRSHPLLKITAALGAFSLLLGGCTSDSLVDPDLEGTASLTVLDSYTGIPIDEVKVEVLGASSKKTGEEGMARFGGLRLGTHQVRLSKSGYETSQEPLTITSTGTQEVVAVNVSATYRLHKQGPSIKGRIFLHPQSGPDTSATIGASKVQVELRLTATGTGSGNTVYAMPTRTVTTDTNGYYTFLKLPEGSTFTLAVPEFTRNGKLYSLPATALSTANLTGGSTYTHTPVVLLPTTVGALSVFAPTTQLASNQGWVFEFSSGIDTSRFVSATAIQLRAGTFAMTSTRTWSQGFKVLSIRPAAGTWAATTTYSVQLSGVRDSTNRLLPLTTFTSSL